MATQPTDDQIDMLIRSTSSVLRMVKSQVSLSSAFAPSSPTVSLLDRIALLLVTKSDADAVAVTTDLRQENITIRVAADDASVRPEVLVVVPNPHGPRYKPMALEEPVGDIPSVDRMPVYLQAPVSFTLAGTYD
ncbi:hypothetical protein FRB94_008597 [Tulasnella sp. JGI-2019a]|nr:hypothetical protein FRB93_008389 [Tulasnella sp. JGI-2019a]KAG8995984.1 hypothetical protein FRB94_008597 [Tulasnella sp. JGI-2019a]KAG9027125.1 hypothetical protein FRB95_008122 [Tulasnella sp. JGI-2019a]